MARKAFDILSASSTPTSSGRSPHQASITDSSSQEVSDTESLSSSSPDTGNRGRLDSFLLDTASGKLVKSLNLPIIFATSLDITCRGNMVNLEWAVVVADHFEYSLLRRARCLASLSSRWGNLIEVGDGRAMFETCLLWCLPFDCGYLFFVGPQQAQGIRTHIHVFVIDLVVFLFIWIYSDPAKMKEYTLACWAPNFVYCFSLSTFRIRQIMSGAQADC